MNDHWKSNGSANKTGSGGNDAWTAGRTQRNETGWNKDQSSAAFMAPNKRFFIEVFAGGGYSYDNPEDGDIKLMFYDEENPESGEAAGSNDFGPDFNLFLGFTF